MQEGEESKHEEITDSNLKAELAEFEAGHQTMNGQTIVTEGDEIQPVLAATIEAKKMDGETIVREAQSLKALLGSDLLVPATLSDKEEILGYLRDINDRIMQDVMKNEEFIDSLRQSHADADKIAANLGKEPFTISKITKGTSIEFLIDNEVPLESWIGDIDDNEKVKKILKVWFTLQGRYNQKEWCAFPANLDHTHFYEGGAKLVLL